MYLIANYDKRYMPRDKSRHPLLHADYVKMPVNPQGDGLKTLLKYKRGLEVFGIWCLLLEKATDVKPENRGKLLNHKDEVATPTEIALGISLEKQIKLVTYALSVLVEMGWVKCVKDAEKCGESAPLSVVKCSEVKCSEVKEKMRHLEFVFLTPAEHDKLVEKLGIERTASWIEELNNAIGSKGYKYKSHYHTILNWQRRYEKKNETAKKVKQKLFPIKGKNCCKRDCGLPAVYKDHSGDYENYYCAQHMPEKVKKLYE